MLINNFLQSYNKFLTRIGIITKEGMFDTKIVFNILNIIVKFLSNRLEIC